MGVGDLGESSLRRRERNERREGEPTRAKLEAETRAREAFEMGRRLGLASRKAANRRLSTDSQSFYKIWNSTNATRRRLKRSKSYHLINFDGTQ